MKIPQDVLSGLDVAFNPMAFIEYPTSLEAIVRDCAKVCMNLPCRTSAGEVTAIELEEAILTRYGLLP